LILNLLPLTLAPTPTVVAAVATTPFPTAAFVAASF